MNRGIGLLAVFAVLGTTAVLCEPPPEQDPRIARIEELLEIREKYRPAEYGSIPADFWYALSPEESELSKRQTAERLIEIYKRFDRKFLRGSTLEGVCEHILDVATRTEEQGSRYRGPTIAEVRSWYAPLLPEILRLCDPPVFGAQDINGMELKALACVTGLEAAPKLLQVLREGPTHRERSYAITALSRIGGTSPEIARALCDVVVGELRFPKDLEEISRLNKFSEAKRLKEVYLYAPPGHMDSLRAVGPEVLYPGIRLREQAALALAVHITEETFLRALRHFLTIRDPDEWNWQQKQLADLTEDEILWTYVNSDLLKLFGLEGQDYWYWTPEEFLRWWELNGRPSPSPLSKIIMDDSDYSRLYRLDSQK